MGGAQEQPGGTDHPGGRERADPYLTPPPAGGRPPEWGPGAPDQGPAFGTPPPPPRRSRGGLALTLGIVGLVLSVLVSPVGLALDIAAIVLAVRELRRSGRDRVPTPGAAIAGLLAGAVGAVLALIITAAIVAFYPQVRDYTDCLGGANTVADQQQCRAEFERGVQRRFGGG